MAVSISDYPIVVVGSGFFGATVARQIAEFYGLEVLVIDKRSHIGGNSYSKVDEASGIEYHAYGSHNSSTPQTKPSGITLDNLLIFNNYRHRVLTRHKGRVYTMPINLLTINSFFEKNFTPAEAEAFLLQEVAREIV